MKCFNHNEIEAVGQCKQCYKGLCSNCVVDLGHGIACKDKHEHDVQKLFDLVQNNAKSYSSSPKAWFFKQYLFINNRNHIYYTRLLSIRFLINFWRCVCADLASSIDL